MYAIEITDMDLIDNIYDGYLKKQLELNAQGYTPQEVFWVNLASLPLKFFRNQRSENCLRHVLHFYATIYNE